MLGPKSSLNHLGVNFEWAVAAHNVRMTAICNTSRGILTAADGEIYYSSVICPLKHIDLLVKLWSSEGYIMGVLKQNVLSGMRSPTWNLTVDVEPYIEKEETKVAEILSEVDTCEEQEISNDLSNYDLSLRPSTALSAIFARSELRKRIDLSSKILALDFNSTADSKTQAMYAIFSDDRSLSSIADSISIASSLSKASKSSAQALLDLRSTDDQLSSTSNLTLDQRRRKQKTIDAVGNHYLKRSGVVLPLVDKGKSAHVSEPKIFEWEREERKVANDLPKKASLYLLPKASSASATLQAIDEKCSKRGGKAFDDLNKALRGLT